MSSRALSISFLSVDQEFKALKKQLECWVPGDFYVFLLLLLLCVCFFYLSDIIFFKQPALIENFTVPKLVFTETFLWLVFSLYYF